MTTDIQKRHTPAPWIAKEDDEHHSSYAHIIGDKGEYIARVPLYSHELDKHRPEQEANARLIAAAPELLDALQVAVKHMNDPYPAGDDLSHVLARAEAAIAKANGE